MGFVTQWVWKNSDKNLRMWVSVLICRTAALLVMLNFYNVVS